MHIQLSHTPLYSHCIQCIMSVPATSRAPSTPSTHQLINSSTNSLSNFPVLMQASDDSAKNGQMDGLASSRGTGGFQTITDRPMGGGQEDGPTRDVSRKLQRGWPCPRPRAMGTKLAALLAWLLGCLGLGIRHICNGRLDLVFACCSCWSQPHPHPEVTSDSDSDR